MIYLLYLAEDSGLPIWKYEHPRTPSIILEHIVGKDDAIIVGYLSTISNFSKVMLGEYVQSIKLGNFNMYYWYFNLADKKLIGLVVCDAKDSKEAVYSTVYEFIERGESVLRELLSETDKPDADPSRIEFLSRKLESLLQTILDERTRTPPVLAYRDNKSIAIGSVVAYIFFLFMLYITIQLDNYFNWLAMGEYGILLSVIAILNLILPSIVLGYVVGFKSGASKGGILTGMAILITLLVLWFPYVEQWATTWKLRLFALPIFAIIVIVLGGAIGLIASYIAEVFVEHKYLVPPSETEVLREEPEITEKITEREEEGEEAQSENNLE